jgi:hypothetical protein
MEAIKKIAAEKNSTRNKVRPLGKIRYYKLLPKTIGSLALSVQFLIILVSSTTRALPRAALYVERNGFGIM